MSDAAESPQLSPPPPIAVGLDPAAALALLQQGADAIAVCDAGGRVAWCNRRLLELAAAESDADRSPSLSRLLALSPADGARLDDALRAGREGALPPMRCGPRGEWWSARLAPLPDGRCAVHWRRVDALHLPQAVAPRPANDAAGAWTLAPEQAQAAEHLGLALDLADIVMFRHDLRTQRVQISDKAFALLGLPRGDGELEVDELRSLVHEDDRELMRAGFDQTLATGGPVDSQVRFRNADGSWRHVLIRRLVRQDGDGRPEALLGVGLDLSEQVERQRQQTDLMRQFELTTRAAGIGYWSLEGATGRARWSQQTFIQHGLPPTADAPTTREWLVRCVHPEDREAVRRRYRAWARSGGPNLEQEFRIVRTDGAVRHMLSYSRLEGTPGRYDFYGVLIDATERRTAEAALHQASARAALAIRGAGMGTWEQDMRSGHAIWDEQMWRLRGLQPRPEALSVDERMALVHPDDREPTRQALAAATQDGRPWNLEFRVRWPDGQWRRLASRSIAVRDAQGQPTRRIGVNWDVTDMRSTQSEREEKLLAQRASQAKSRFLSRMSHELRTPLNAVLGFAQLLLSEGDRVGIDTRRRHLERIGSAGRHLLALIDDMLDLSSMESGEMPVVAQAVPLAALVAQTLPLVERQARQRKVKLRGGALSGVALGDPTRLRQVLLNLLTNAIKYNRDGGQALVEAGADDVGAWLRVSDTGRGMSAEQLQHAFEPFNRLGLEHEPIEGTGIGLAIVKSLVERMGGSVQASSTPGAGSVFEVRLPDGTPLEAAGAAPAAPGSVASPLALGTGRPGRLLYIEDNPVNLLIVQEALAQRGDLQLQTAVDGQSGVGLAQSDPPDLILVDMQLPDIDGHEVLRRLRDDPRTSAIPCISVSANAMPEDIRRALQAGFADYWTKPLDLDMFMRSLDTIFGSTWSVTTRS